MLLAPVKNDSTAEESVVTGGVKSKNTSLERSGVLPPPRSNPDIPNASRRTALLVNGRIPETLNRPGFFVRRAKVLVSVTGICVTKIWLGDIRSEDVAFKPVASVFSTSVPSGLKFNAEAKTSPCGASAPS